MNMSKKRITHFKNIVFVFNFIISIKANKSTIYLDVIWISRLSLFNFKNFGSLSLVQLE